MKNSALPRILVDVVADLADLVQKEMRLAKVELADRISTKLRGGIWLGVAAVLGLVGALFVLQGIVFGIATFGIALHWACLIVAGFLILVAFAAYAKGRADAREDLTPIRTIRQVKRDIATAKEQLT